jgi:hypothetical protein
VTKLVGGYGSDIHICIGTGTLSTGYAPAEVRIIPSIRFYYLFAGFSIRTSNEFVCVISGSGLRNYGLFKFISPSMYDLAVHVISEIWSCEVISTALEYAGVFTVSVPLKRFCPVF